MAQSTTPGSDTVRPRRATYQDVLDAPAHRVAEIIDGTLSLSPRPSPREAWATMREGEWALIASAKDDEQVGIRPFESIKVSLGELWR